MDITSTLSVGKVFVEEEGLKNTIFKKVPSK